MVMASLDLAFCFCLGGLYSWVLLVSLHVNVVLDKVDSWRQSRRLCTRLQNWFLLASISLHECITKQAGMSCAQPQAEAVSLEQKASFLLKIYIRPVVAEIFPLSLGFKFG
jgi:hypothetical protein